jgi:hypothetical protein
MNEDVKRRLIFKDPPKDNSAAYPVLKEVLYDVHKCEDCNKLIDKRREVVYQKNTTPYTHWSVQCRLCGLYKNPDTGDFDCTNMEKRAIIYSKVKKGDK